MAVVGRPRQQPNDVQDYDIDYSEWFPLDDEIVGAVISCEPAMPMPPSFAIESPRVKVWVYAGGTDDETYKVTVRAITSGGREKEAELLVRIKEV